MKFDFHILIIGAGSAGLVVASGAAGLGAKVALVESEKMGGDCLNWGCVPSKSFLKSAHVADYISKGDIFGIDATLNTTDLNKVMKRVSSVIKSIEPHDSIERYESLGVTVIKGYGKLQDPHHVEIDGKVYSSKIIVLATGSSTSVPHIKGLNDVAYLTNKTVFDLEKLPERLVILGAGPIACELGQGFSHLGSKVTMINRSAQLFKKDEPEVSPLMLQRFILDGINMELGARIVEIRENNSREIEVDIEKDGNLTTIVADKLIVALGREPNTKNIGLEKVGIRLSESGHIATNEKLQTTIPNVYACGDVAGPFAFTHMASYQAGIVIQNAIFPIKKKVNYRAVSWVTYTKPEVAHVGYIENQLIQEEKKYKKYMAPIIENDRAKAESDAQGFLKILVDARGVVVGATLVGEKAGEMIGLANMAIVRKMKVTSFISMIFPYPTELEIYKTIALEAMKEGFKPWQKNIVKKLFLRD
ncbi:dihydrolipoyl dehydrogenase family protein [Proteocatella sphenisci]|uniref:dihydrolipoyl dehydrogenase family protein n=1 Tax=Proteocatella sphenisci TaxID=181070 RepID=UPI00048D45B8|nr:FAD-dependent oxidoreductase [Proteocatella sphenisci]